MGYISEIELSSVVIPLDCIPSVAKVTDRYLTTFVGSIDLKAEAKDIFLVFYAKLKYLAIPSYCQ
jgi:hypothetical protein